MTRPNTPTKAPTGTPAEQELRSSVTASPRARDLEQPDPRRSSGRLVWAGIAAALAAAIWLVVAGLTADLEPAPTAQTNQASTERLQGLADQYEAVRSARANQATADRLQRLADQYEAVRSARASQAATDRLQGLADQFQPAP